MEYKQIPMCEGFREENKITNKKSPITGLQEALKDKDYYISWQANIAMAFYNNYNWAKDKTDILRIANNSATYFLEQIMKL